jgi:hypothetical protein
MAKPPFLHLIFSLIEPANARVLFGIDGEELCRGEKELSKKRTLVSSCRACPKLKLSADRRHCDLP